MNSYPRRYRAAQRGMAGIGSLFILLTAVTACTLGPPRPDVLIATGSPSSTYHKLGGSICRLFNLNSTTPGRRCGTIASSGPIDNVQALLDGQIDVGIVQSDVLTDSGAAKNNPAPRRSDLGLRVLFASHADAFTIVVRRDLMVHSALQLRGKRVNMGSPGSGERASMERIMAALGVTGNDFAEVHELTRAEQYNALCANKLDAIIYEVAHPNGLIQDVVQRCQGVLIDLRGKAIDDMLQQHPEYISTTIPGASYQSNPGDVQTIGVRAMVVTTTRLSDGLAYQITKAVFESFQDFKSLHPDFSTLSIADMVSPVGAAPLHPGATRYYRERGWVP